MNTIALKDLFVGYADGKTEAEMTERDFTDMFYTGNSKVTEISNPTKFIISGRKGTGKTILAMYSKKMAENKHKSLCSRYIYMPESIKLEEFIERQFKDIAQDEYNLFSLFYIYKVISNLITENKTKYREYLKLNNENNAVKEVIKYYRYRKNRRFLRKWFTSRYNQGDYFKNSFEDTNSASQKKSLGVKHNEISAYFDSNKTNSRTTEYRIAHFTSELQRIKYAVFACLEVQPIFIVFDDIDDIKNYIKDDTNLQSFLIGFIKAVNIVNKEISKLGNANKCIAIIRDDILQNLNSFDGNLNKILSDSEVNIDWIGNNEEELLIDMIMNKMAISISQPYNNYNEVKRIIFSKPQKAQDIFKLILKRGFGRPRDVIFYLNTIFKQNGEANAITDDYVRQAYPQYSTYFWNELKNELSFYYKSEYIETIERLLSSNGKKNFTFSGIKSFYMSHSSEYKEINDFDEFMENLYKFGIIGSFRRGDGKTERASFYYRKGSKRKLDKNDMIAVHYGLRPEFNL